VATDPEEKFGYLLLSCWDGDCAAAVFAASTPTQKGQISLAFNLF
jgi:hypothetical protein